MDRMEERRQIISHPSPPPDLRREGATAQRKTTRNKIPAPLLLLPQRIIPSLNKLHILSFRNLTHTTSPRSLLPSAESQPPSPQLLAKDVLRPEINSSNSQPPSLTDSRSASSGPRSVPTVDSEWMIGQHSSR